MNLKISKYEIIEFPNGKFGIRSLVVKTDFLTLNPSQYQRQIWNLKESEDAVLIYCQGDKNVVKTFYNEIFSQEINNYEINLNQKIRETNKRYKKKRMLRKLKEVELIKIKREKIKLVDEIEKLTLEIEFLKTKLSKYEK